MPLSLKYGTSQLSGLPGNARTISLPERSLPEPEQAIRKALEAPIASAPLSRLVKPGEKIVIVTSDITRYTASELYLPILVDQLNTSGIPDSAIEIVIALGIHRQQSPEEHQKIVGPLYGRIKVSDHDCDDPEQLVEVGTTASGMPVRVNRTVAEADRLIVTGTVGLHYFAGFGGGRKSLIPGIASRQTCMATHFAIFNPPAVGGKHPAARPANLDGNPVHEIILEAAQMLQPDFIFNTVLTPDKKIAAAFAGEMNATHLLACQAARELYTVNLERPADLAVVSCGGHPKDINFIQSQKALDYGTRALKPGGTIILLAACPDGFGHATFYDWFRFQDLDQFEAALRENYEINGQTAHATLEKARRYRIILISNFNQTETETMGMEKAETLDQALAMAYEKLPPDPETVIIPDGGTILPIIKMN